MTRSRRSRTDGAPVGAQGLGRLATRDGLFAVNSEQRITHWSESARGILGVSVEPVGRRCFDVLGGTDARNGRYCQKDCPVVSNARRGRGTRDFNIHIADKDGRPRVLNVSILVDRSGDDMTVLHLFRDVTRERLVGQLPLSLPTQPADEGGDPMTCALTPPTPRQLEVIRLLAEGAEPRQIAHTLGLSPVTVRNHIQAAMERLGAHTRVQVVIAAAQAGLL